MRIIKPLDMTEGKLLSSSVPEDDRPSWNSTTAYVVGAEVIRGHRIWEALVDNTGVDPLTQSVVSPTWLDVGATNRWKMFDDKVGSVTEASQSITVTVRPGEVVNSLGMFNLLARSVTIGMVDPVDGSVYSHKVEMVNTGVEDWYDYFLSAFERSTDFVITDVPSYGTADLQITIENPGAQVLVGHIAMGVLFDLGVAQYGTSVGITDYSRKERDDFGTSSVVERAFSKRAEFDVAVETRRVSRLQRVLASIRAKPVVWIGERSIEATVIFGFFKDFNISISGPEYSDATITVEGLV